MLSTEYFACEGLKQNAELSCPNMESFGKYGMVRNRQTINQCYCLSPVTL